MVSLSTKILMVMEENDGLNDDAPFSAVQLMAVTRHVGRERASC